MIRGGMSNDSEKRLFGASAGVSGGDRKNTEMPDYGNEMHNYNRILCIHAAGQGAHGKNVDNMLYKDYYSSITKMI